MGEAWTPEIERRERNLKLRGAWGMDERSEWCGESLARTVHRREVGGEGRLRTMGERDRGRSVTP